MKVTVVCPNLASNGAGRAFLLAELISRTHDTEIVEFSLGGTLWEPLHGKATTSFRAIPVRDHAQLLRRLPDLLTHLDGDVLYASKPLATSFLAALMARKKRPLILDIDDWELGWARNRLLRAYDRGALQLVRQVAVRTVPVYRWDGDFLIWLSERLVPLADRITVSSSFLQRRFGGELIVHARDRSDLVPNVYTAESARAKLNLPPGGHVVGFVGTVMPHKGLEDLIDAVHLTGEHDLSLLVVGVDDRRSYDRDLLTQGTHRLGARFYALKACPMRDLPLMLAAVDIVVIPQRRTPFGEAQLPAKLFDAMAMAKPIVGTRVSDIPTILDDCGWLVEPSQPAALAATLRMILAGQDAMRQRGFRARERLLELYSPDAVSRRLSGVIEGALKACQDKRRQI